MHPPANAVELPDEPLATTSHGLKHLDQLVDEALLPLLGQAPDRDDDGDIRVESGTAVVFVRTGSHAPVITIWERSLSISATWTARSLRWRS